MFSPFVNGMVVGFFFGGMVGFVAAAILAMSGRCSDDEERMRQMNEYCRECKERIFGEAMRTIRSRT